MSEGEPATIAPEWIRRLTRGEFMKMAETGIFDREKVELLYGQVVVMTQPRPPHEESSWMIGELLRSHFGERVCVRSGLSFAASDDSQPLPDIVVAPRGPYWTEHPALAHLIVEVSRTSLRKDLGLKARLYSEVDVEEYWVVDVDGGVVHVLRDADKRGRWASHRTAVRGETLTLAAFPDLQICVSDILPPV